jgi:hypothetical protein
MSSWTLPGRPRACLLEAANVSWFRMNGKGEWVRYGDQDNEALEVAFRKGESKAIFLDQTYAVDVPKRKQKRISSNTERPVCPASPPTPAQNKLPGPACVRGARCTLTQRNGHPRARGQKRAVFRGG